MSDVKKFTKNEYKVVAVEGNTFVVKNEKGITQRRKEAELQKIDPGAVEDGGFEKKGGGEGVQSGEEKGAGKAAVSEAGHQV